MKARSQLILFLLLAFTLLFAQQGAAVHALSHLSETLPGHSQQDKQLPHSPACDKCVVYAGMGSALASSAFSPQTAAAQAPQLETIATVLLTQAVRPYLARAPPSLV